jgi:hypothetical protein
MSDEYESLRMYRATGSATGMFTVFASQAVVFTTFNLFKRPLMFPSRSLGAKLDPDREYTMNAAAGHAAASTVARTADPVSAQG